MYAVTVFYPLSGGARFDLDYYMNKHVPLVKELLEPMGLRQTRILRGVPSGGQDPEFGVMAALFFDDEASLMAALAAHGPVTQADIPNFTDAVPHIQFSEVLQDA